VNKNQIPFSLTVAVPIYNEEKNIPAILPEIIRECRTNKWELVIVDDGSKDNSYSLLKELCDSDFITLIHHKLNRGYGGALKSAISCVTTSHVVTIDGDGQHQVSDIARMFEYARANDADLVVGNRGRLFTENFFRSLGKWIIRLFTRLLLPLPIQDLNSGFKLYRADLAQQYLILCPDSMAFSDIMTLVHISQRNLVLEYPIHINNRKSGRSTINLRTAFETILEILNIAMLFNPLRIFFPAALFFILFGFAWGFPIILRKDGVSVGAMLAIVSGLLLLFIGLIASQLASIRLSSLARPQGNRSDPPLGAKR